MFWDRRSRWPTPTRGHPVRCQTREARGSDLTARTHPRSRPLRTDVGVQRRPDGRVVRDDDVGTLRGGVGLGQLLLENRPEVLELLGGERASEAAKMVSHILTYSSIIPGTAGSVISPATTDRQYNRRAMDSRSFVESTDLRGEFSIEIFLHDSACSDQTIRCQRKAIANATFGRRSGSEGPCPKRLAVARRIVTQHLSINPKLTACPWVSR